MNSSVSASCEEQHSRTNHYILSLQSEKGEVYNTYLKVHVGIDGKQDASVFHAPLELHKHSLTSQVGEERLRIHNAL
jgi:hypothetical protein